MTFDEWWASYIKPASIYTLKETTEDAWDAGVQEGLRRNREWVGLTDDELEDVSREWWDGRQTSMEMFEMLRTLEAKLKEKNT